MNGKSFCLTLSYILFNLVESNKFRAMSILEFNTQFNKLTSLLHSFAYNLTKNSEDASDLYQDTALRALSNKDKFRPGTNFKAWSFTIMKNIFINNYRKKVKRNTIIDSTDNMYFINSAVKIENDAEVNILMKELGSMISSLEDSLRIPFLKHFAGYKYQEIAEELDLPLGTVKSRIFFARKALKSKIQAQYGDVDMFKVRLAS